ncbi:alpha/beta hydrolase [Massilia sp. X63]|uniref:alpha/beta hydrolase n=1 Tax=Massilia sp. X63 TaxID=3237285 RepID=UPI0034DD09B8
MSGRIVVENFASSVLFNNPLGDPALRQVPVYLPPGYDADTDMRYPTVYLLAGFNGRGTVFLNDTPGDETIAQRMDRLIAAGTIRPMILVMPDCLTRLGGSQYINSSATGRYEDHLVGELVPWIDARYRTRATRDARAIAGKSSGGYGALIQAMRHPDVFGLAASHSGDLYFELCYKPAFVKYAGAIGKLGGLDGLLRNLHTLRPRDAGYRAAVNTLAMASCYSPNPQAPHGFDLPFEPHTAEIIDAVWARWLEWDPVHLVGRHEDALRSLRLLYLDAGSMDEFHLQYGARIFCNKLAERGIPFVHEEFEDSHLNIPYRFDSSLAAISRAMSE